MARGLEVPSGADALAKQAALGNSVILTPLVQKRKEKGWPARPNKPYNLCYSPYFDIFAAHVRHGGRTLQNSPVLRQP